MFCPKTVIGVWERQAKQHLNVPYTFSRTLEELEQNYNEGKINFFCTNYEQARILKKQIRKIAWDVMIADESHKIRHRASKQSKALALVSDSSIARMILTGTPIGDHEIDFWAQFRFLSPATFGKNWGPFEALYLTPTGYGGHDHKFRKVKREAFLRKVEPFVYRVPKSVLGLPREVYAEIPVALEPKAHRLYDTLENDLYVKIGKSSITTELKITNLLRLQQLSGGFVKDDDGHIHQVSSAKLDALLDGIEAIDFDRFKCVTFCRFTEEVDLIASNLESVEVLDGRTKNPDKVWMTFQDKKFPRQLVVQEETGGIGIDLFAANYAFFYSVTYSWISYTQAIARLARKGQLNPMTFSRIFGERTVDEDIWQVVDNKGETAEQALSELLRRRKRS